MKCENSYCIYNKEYECILKEIGLDSLGMCEECINVSLDCEFLEREKERQLLELEQRFVSMETMNN